jgi:hypothetical protein
MVVRDDAEVVPLEKSSVFDVGPANIAEAAQGKEGAQAVPAICLCLPAFDRAFLPYRLPALL